MLKTSTPLPYSANTTDHPVLHRMLTEAVRSLHATTGEIPVVIRVPFDEGVPFEAGTPPCLVIQNVKSTGMPCQWEALTIDASPANRTYSVICCERAPADGSEESLASIPFPAMQRFRTFLGAMEWLAKVRKRERAYIRVQQLLVIRAARGIGLDWACSSNLKIDLLIYNAEKPNENLNAHWMDLYCL